MRAAVLLAALLLSAALPGCVLAREPIIIAVSAPKASDAMTIFFVTEGTFSRFKDTTAEYVIYYGDRLIYPPAGKGAVFQMDGRTGTAVVPYNLFVVGNGEYDIVVKFGRDSARTRVSVAKWVEHVWLHPFPQDDVVNVEVALSSATGGRPDDRILSRGELILTIHYRGVDGKLDRIVGQVSGETDHRKPATSFAVPRTRLNQGAGYYSFEPLFHNLEARDNVQVQGDPTMRNLKPPWNWIYVNE